MVCMSAYNDGYVAIAGQDFRQVGMEPRLRFLIEKRVSILGAIHQMD